MRSLRRVLLIGAVGTAAVWVVSAAQAPGELPPYVLTDREGFVLREPRLVAPPPVSGAEWSSDARYVLAGQQSLTAAPGQPPSGAISLVLWSRQTERFREIWQRPAALQHVERIGWLPGTHAALVTVASLETAGEKTGIHLSLLRVDAVRAQVRVLGELELYQQLLVSPRQPLAALFHHDQQYLRAVRADGSLGPVVRLPRSSVTQWSPDGNLLYLQDWEPPAVRGQPPVTKWYAVDLRAGSVTDLPKAPERYEERPLPLRVRASVATLKEENTIQRVHPLWLESSAKSEHPRALACADSDEARLAPDLSALLYISQGAAWVAPITRMPREQMLAQIRAAHRELAVSRARQIGLGMMMYIQDYDDVFPPPGSGVVDQLRPYVRDEEVFNAPDQNTAGFIYTLKGGTLKSITDPATTVFGYLPGPGGRAVIYVDGHVEWKAE